MRRCAFPLPLQGINLNILVYLFLFYLSLGIAERVVVQSGTLEKDLGEGS